MNNASFSRIRRKMLNGSKALQTLRDKASAEAEALGPEECRKRLAEWAKQPGRTKEEVEMLNEMGRLDS